MKVTHESSVEVYKRLLKSVKPAYEVPMKRYNLSSYAIDGKNVVAIVRTEDRKDGIRDAIKLLGGLKPLIKGINGKVVIKPNCNTDDPFPRNTDAETIGIIAECLIMGGIPAEHIIVGDMSGRYRGLPTRNTMKNMGIIELTEELGIQTAYFEDEDWVTLRHPLAKKWTNGIKIPKSIYEAERIIFTPILRPHEDATFSMCMKLGVGLMDVEGRELLHNGEFFYEKLAEFNLAFPVDLCIVDGLSCFIDSGPEFTKMVNPGIIIVGNNRVATDAIAVSIMKQLGAYGISDKPVLENEQFIWASKLDLGKPIFSEINLKYSNLTDDPNFEQIISKIKDDLTSNQ